MNAPSTVNRVFLALVVFLFVFENFFLSDQIYGMGDVNSLPRFISLGIYLLVSLRYLLRRPTSESKMLWAYIAALLIPLFLRGDGAQFKNGIVTALPLIAIIATQSRVRLSFVNALFVANVGICILLTSLGKNPYGYLPGQAEDHVLDLWWRTNLFAYISPPYSGFFATLVFILNLFYNRNFSRWFLLGLSFYFLALAGNRTSYLCVVFALGVYVHRWVTPRVRTLSLRVFTAAFFAMVLAVNVFPEALTAGLQKIQGSENVFVRQDVTEDVRLQYMAYHGFVLVNSSFLGGGTEGVNFAQDLGIEAGGATLGDSECRLTYLLARDGIFLLPFLIFLFLNVTSGIRRNDLARTALGMQVVFFLLFYGSFMTPYNFAPLILFACLLNGIDDEAAAPV